MEQMSCKITAKVSINIDSNQFKVMTEAQISKYNARAYNCSNGGYVLPFTIVDNNGKSHEGAWIKKTYSNGKEKKILLVCTMFNMISLDVVSQSGGKFDNFYDDKTSRSSRYLEINEKHLDVTITFEPEPKSFINQQKLNEKIEEYLKIIGPFEQSKNAEDILFISNNEKLAFFKSWLTKMSPNFNTMFEHTKGKFILNLISLPIIFGVNI